MVSNEETILKRGYLDRLGPRTESDGWERLYFVLYGSSAKNEARLDWFDSRRCSESNSGLRNGIFLEEISRVERLLCPPSTDDDDGGGGGSTCGRQRQSQPPPGPARTTLALYPLRQKKPILLRCGDDDEDSVDEWMRQLEAALKMTKTPSSEGGKTKVSSRDNGDNAEPIYTPSLHTAHASTGCDTMTFDAEVEETKASSRQGLFGCYRLVISRQHLSLLDPTDSTTVLTWHYSHVRRFGYSDRSFSIEGGQRSGSGQGLFILKTHDGQRLFEDIQLRIRSLKSSSPSDNSSCASSAATTLPPEGEEGSCTGGVKGQPPIPPRIYPPLNGANGHFGMTSSSNKSSPKTKRDKKDEGQGQMTESPARMDHLEEEEEEEEEKEGATMGVDEGQPRISEVLSQLRSLEEGTGRYNDAHDQLYASVVDDPDADFCHATYSRISLRGSGGSQAPPPRPAKTTTENPYGHVLVSLRKEERREELKRREEKEKRTKNKNTFHQK